MWPSLRRTCHHSLIISHINIAPTVSYIDIVLSFEKNIFCVKWDKMKCVAPSVSSHRRISISPARNCFNIQELPEFQECKRKTTAAGQIWKNNRVLSSFHKHFHSEAAPHWSPVYCFLSGERRQHCRLSICWYFDWVWQIRRQAPNKYSDTIRRGALSESCLCLCFVFTIEAKIHFAFECFGFNLLYSCLDLITLI